MNHPSGLLRKVARPDALIAVFGLMVVGIIWAATLTVIARDEEDASEQAIQATERLLDTYESQSLRALNEVHQSLRLIAYARRFSREDDTLAQLQEQNLLLPNLLFTTRIVAASGRVLASSREAAVHWPVTQDVLDAGAGSQSPAYMGRPYRLDASQEALVDISRKIEPDEPDSERVVITFPVSYLVSDYDQTRFGTQGLLAFVGLDGTSRARRVGTLISSGEAVDLGDINLQDANDEQASAQRQRTPWDGVMRYTASRRLYGLPLAVMVGLAEGEALKAARQEGRRKRIQATVATVLVFAVALAVGLLTRRILELSERERLASMAHAQQVEFLAYNDSLTGLPNRAHFNAALAQCLAENRAEGAPFALMFLDLDGFKTINDMLGHQAGDTLLVQVAKRLKQCVRGNDLVARLGGDEFVVILGDAPRRAEIAEVGRRIIDKLGRPYSLDGRHATVTASIGVAVYPDNGHDEESMTRAADHAMYAAKSQGKNLMLFSTETPVQHPDA
jgi:diguanylate cyclase (GGDEF)-like protein